MNLGNLKRSRPAPMLTGEGMPGVPGQARSVSDASPNFGETSLPAHFVQKKAMLGALLAGPAPLPPPKPIGRVRALNGSALRARLPGVQVGELLDVSSAGRVLPAEVVGFDGGEATLMILGEAAGVSSETLVRPSGKAFSVRCGDFLLGRVLDGLGRPLDGRPLPHSGGVDAPLNAGPPDPLSRRPVRDVFKTGVRAIDGVLTMGRGQRMGLFAGAGVGKSTLLGQIARHARSDVNVICLVGERGREVREFVEGSLGPEGLRRSVVVCATSDQPPMVRLKSAFVATAMAEHFRDRGTDVLFLMDSVTRLARAQREIGLAAGEPPARQGYPPSVFRMLPALLERAGNSDRGTMTAVYTVLVSGGDMEEPVADEVRSILDGHVVLSRELANRGHYPAIDVLASVSRVMGNVASAGHRAAASRLRSLLGRYEANRDLISIGAYKKGADPALDEAVAAYPAIERWLRQENDSPAAFAETVANLRALGGGE